MKLRANEQGTEEPPMLDNFIDFLTLFGHFVSNFSPTNVLEMLNFDDRPAKSSRMKRMSPSPMTKKRVRLIKKGLPVANALPSFARALCHVRGRGRGEGEGTLSAPMVELPL
jgi:hypothetical protein